MEILIKGGRIVDGAGNPWYTGNVGINKGKIVFIGSVHRTANREFDCRDLMVCPGFIDTHSHSDFVFLNDPLSSFKLMQGVTTEVIGNCGFSAAPVPKSEKFRKLYHDYILPISSSPSLNGVRLRIKH